MVGELSGRAGDFSGESEGIQRKRVGQIPWRDGAELEAHRRAHLHEHMAMMRWVRRRPFDG